MNRRAGATGGAGRARNASTHRPLNQPVSERVPNLRRTINTTNRKCIHVR